MSQEIKAAVHCADMARSHRENFCKANYSIFFFFFPSQFWPCFGLVLLADWVLNHNSEQKELQFCPTCQTQFTAKRLIPKLPNNAVAAVGVKPDVYKNFESYVIPLLQHWCNESSFRLWGEQSNSRDAIKWQKNKTTTKKQLLNMSWTWREREKKRMHAGIWVIEEREKERETEVPGTKAVLYHLNDFWSESFKTSPEG